MKKVIVITCFIWFYHSGISAQNVNYREVFFEVDSVVIDSVPEWDPNQKEYSLREVYRNGDIFSSQTFHGKNRLKTVWVDFDSVAVYLGFDESGYCVNFISIITPNDRKGHIYEFERDLSLNTISEGFVVPNGMQYRYYKTGELFSEMIYNNGLKDGYYKEYYPNGSLAVFQEFRDDKTNEIYQDFYSNGSIRAQWFYKNDKIDGKKIFYNEDGTISTVQYWKEGILLENDR
ncbi:hypothetical protein G3O08_11610 [Cryomorpha ignava]|uniref:Toxin-antitoxin system YwqK family antitoxin n=1 Tax=Cryomorpha ignava TaxID=101383 RepID=A0A7K3WRI7_9FLAO|nr:hypothetical protein [Cryomorpha ignava]NEN24148.1 hypothetical protein [Cryomorpha ignava]